MRVGNIHELTSPKYPLRDRLKKKLRTTQRRMVRMIIQTKTQAGKSCAGREAASVDVTADAEPHDPNSEQGNDTTEHNNQDPKEHEESSHDADSNRCFDKIPEDSPQDELEPWVDYIKREHHTKRTTCQQQTEPRRGFSGSATSTVGRQG